MPNTYINTYICGLFCSWKYFANAMDANQCSICGEESFGTGSDHVRYTAVEASTKQHQHHRSPVSIYRCSDRLTCCKMPCKSWQGVNGKWPAAFVQGEGRPVGGACMAFGASIRQQGPGPESAGEGGTCRAWCAMHGWLWTDLDLKCCASFILFDMIGCYSTGLHLPGSGDKQTQQLVTVEHLVRSHWAKWVTRSSVAVLVDCPVLVMYCRVWHTRQQTMALDGTFSVCASPAL
jgi:Phosphoglucomutase/phosphomannomutase, alpha/beta/alpha domain III